ncbi:hypothetical protein [Mumia zhuanghuii]|nr:hypothetical protein [Mumia zhuanghuii]
MSRTLDLDAPTAAQHAAATVAEALGIPAPTPNLAASTRPAGFVWTMAR